MSSKRFCDDFSAETLRKKPELQVCGPPSEMPVQDSVISVRPEYQNIGRRAKSRKPKRQINWTSKDLHFVDAFDNRITKILELTKNRIIIFDAGPGMDGSAENSIVKCLTLVCLVMEDLLHLCIWEGISPGSLCWSGEAILVGNISTSIVLLEEAPDLEVAEQVPLAAEQKLEDVMQEIGLKIKHHEDNVKFLKVQKNRLDDSILDIRVALGKIHLASGTGSENQESSNGWNEEETIEQIIRYDKSAAGICCQLQTHHRTQITHVPFMKDVIGIVALLGKVDDANLSRTLSDYLGLETMLAVVCKTCDGLKALETYDKEGLIDKSSGLHGLGASIGRPLDDRYLVICLENLRPYTGEFIADDPQRRLAIRKPRYLNEETPRGFLGFAVNMINLDSANLYCVTSTGHGLRETLFYKLFSRLQVYKTRADMLQALPFISDGAISLDGGIIKSGGIFSLGEREVEIVFPGSSGRTNLPENYFDTENRLKELRWEKARFLEDLHREQELLDCAKLNFEKKKQELLNFLA